MDNVFKTLSIFFLIWGFFFDFWSASWLSFNFFANTLFRSDKYLILRVMGSYRLLKISRLHSVYVSFITIDAFIFYAHVTISLHVLFVDLLVRSTLALLKIARHEIDLRMWLYGHFFTQLEFIKFDDLVFESKMLVVFLSGSSSALIYSHVLRLSHSIRHQHCSVHRNFIQIDDRVFTLHGDSIIVLMLRMTFFCLLYKSV